MRPRTTRSSQRGSALILAVLILFSMLGMGMIAMRTATQTIASAGNLRLTKQARYVAEMGLYHAISLIQSERDALLRLRQSATDYLEIESTGTVRVRDRLDQPIVVQNRPPPGLFQSANALEHPLGMGGLTAGLVPSYRVRVEGFGPGAPQAGVGLDELRRNNLGYCLIEFTSRGFVADQALPTQADMDRPGRESQLAEHTLKAAMVLGPFSRDQCPRL